MIRSIVGIMLFNCFIKLLYISLKKSLYSDIPYFNKSKIKYLHHTKMIKIFIYYYISMKKSFILSTFVVTTLIIIVLCQWDLQDYGIIISPEHKAKYMWGTYKPNLYFAMKERKNSTHVFGIMWYGADKKENYEKQGNITDRTRHDCNMNDNLKYHWKAHNGEDYGQQHIHDEVNELRLATTFTKRAANETLQTWDVIINGDRLSKYYDKSIEKNNSKEYSERESNKTISLILYTALENFLIEEKSYFSKLEHKESEILNNDSDNKESEENNIKEKYMDFYINNSYKGNEAGFMKISILKKSLLNYSIQKYRKKYEENWKIKRFITEDLKKNEITLFGKEYALFSETKQLKTPNIVAIQLIVKAPFKIRVSYSTEETQLNNISNKKLNKYLQAKLNQVNKRFDNVFVANYQSLEIISNQSEIYLLKSMMKEAISNIFGGIGYYWGKIKINFDEESKKGAYHQGFRYTLDEKGLFTGSPSRSFFARGFLWDEGFHNILISQMNYNITIDIIDSWLSTMSATGYMAREQIRGNEQEAQVDDKFIEQNKLIANPPTFIFPINNLINFYKFYNEERDIKLVFNFLKKVYDKFSSWYEWFEFYQKSSGNKNNNNKANNKYYSWQGRNSEHNLASGLDDFPRGMTPNIYEKHLDLYIWVMELIKCLRNLAEIFDFELVSHFDTKLSQMKKDMNEFKDNKLNIYNDFLGPQFKLIETSKFKRPVFPISWRGDNKCGNPQNAPNPINAEYTDCNPYSMNNCCSEFGWCGNGPQFCNCPKCKKSLKLEDRGLEKEDTFNPHIGYIELFPLMFGYLDSNSDEFINILKYLASSEELNSPYGIRSLSKSDLLYHTGDDYWRGNIWMNMNYLTLRGLFLYYKNNSEAYELYKSLRNKIVKTVFNDWKRTGTFYENYSDINGKGLKAHPFNGWTSLVVNIITENYETDIF